MLKNNLFRCSAITLLLAGLCLAGKGTYIHAKAGLAEYLLLASWQETLKKGDAVKPWPWADTWPVARMIFPEYDIDLVVLEGDSGNVLAFGPGHMALSSLPGQPGNSIISGHRDTTFRFLQKIQIGDRITIQRRDGSLMPFKVIAAQIIDEAVLDMNIQTDTPLVTLVTCYPFNAVVPGGPERYLVFAEYDETESVTISRRNEADLSNNLLKLL